MLACNSMYNLIDPHYTEKVAIAAGSSKLADFEVESDYGNA